RGPFDLMQLHFLQFLTQAEAQIPHPLTRDLPEFLPARAVGTPTVGIFFDIFLRQYALKCSTSMIQVQHILDEEAVLVERGDEQLIDPFANALAYGDWLAWWRGTMSCHNHASGRQAFIQWEPASLKELDDLARVHPGHACRRRMCERTLELGMLQDAIA